MPDASHSGRSTSIPLVPAPPVETLLALLEPEQDAELSIGHHMLAGSVAGVVEHTFMYPLDTYKTQLQASRLSEPPSFFSVLRSNGFLRLWRGVGAQLLSCAPSHAAYFAAYEAAKRTLGADAGGHRPLAAAASGVLATVLHDAVATPLDVVKQRLQLGYYRGVADCVRTVAREEGAGAFFRSYPTTLLMNMPYAAVTVAANESIKKLLSPADGREPGLPTFLVAGGCAGALAAAATCPLDVVKTRLQTDAAVAGGTAAASAAAVRSRATASVAAALHTAAASAAASRGTLGVVRQLWREGGAAAFFRGAATRMAAHAPSAALSWASYEMCKSLLLRSVPGDTSP